MARLGATLRLARRLRPEQVLTRARFVAERRLLGAAPGALERRYQRLAADTWPRLQDAGGIWGWPPAPLDPGARWRSHVVDEIVSGRITFLNQTLPLPNGADWRVNGASRLWLFHLHGFRYAIDLAVAARRGVPGALNALTGLIGTWRFGHPVDVSDAWHPFVVSERLIAWVVARDVLRGWRRGIPDLERALAWEVARHALYLDEHQERDAGGNHLVKNGVALLVAGCSFHGPAAERWAAHGSAILGRELPRQVLSDGGHHERSPMYHLLVLEDLLMALTAAGRRNLPITVPLAEAARTMQSFAAGLVHPDGEIPLFNDAVLDEAPRPDALIGPSTRPAGPAFPSSGYFLLPVGWPDPGGVLIADCGPPGPEDLPAHVHADALSFELSIGHRRVIVDSGVASYEAGAERDRFRGTVAHNTVRVDGQDQTEVWGAFRAGHRARVTCDEWKFDEDASHLIGSHAGYARMGVIHERRFDALHGSGWRIVDVLRGHGRHQAESRLQLAPGLRWEAQDGRWAAVGGQGRAVLCVEVFGPVRTLREQGVYAARFSHHEATDVLCLTWTGEAPVVFGCWLLLPGGRPSVL